MIKIKTLQYSFILLVLTGILNIIYLNITNAKISNPSSTSGFLTSPLNLGGTDVNGTLPVASGGIGANNLSANMLLMGNGTDPIFGTSTPTIRALTATTTNATSTFMGGVKFNGVVEASSTIRFGSGNTLDFLGHATATLADGSISGGGFHSTGLSFATSTSASVFPILQLYSGKHLVNTGLTNHGAVGIGTSSPFAPLVVVGHNGNTPQQTVIIETDAEKDLGNGVISSIPLTLTSPSFNLIQIATGTNAVVGGLLNEKLFSQVYLGAGIYLGGRNNT